MKHKILSFLTAFAMVLGVIAAPFANVNAAEETTNSVTVHKVLMNKTDFDAFDAGTKGKDETEYNGNSITDLGGFFGDSAKEIDGVFFKLQKPAQGQTNPDVNNDDHWVDVEGSDLDASVTNPTLSGKTEANGLKLDTKGLKGQFRIVEDLEKSTYKGEKGEQLAASKAVPTLITLPLVNNDGVVKEAHVYPKNTQEKPEIDKNFAQDHGLTEVSENNDTLNAGADYKNYQADKATVTADLGKEIPYEVKSKIPQDAKYKKLVWNDTMTNGLTFKQGSLEIKTNQITDFGEGDYTIFEDDRGFELKLTESGLNKVQKAAETQAVEFTLTYTATINSDAVVDIPESNDIKLEYGNKPGKDSEPKEVQPKDSKITVTKTWADGENTNAPEGVKVVYTLQKKNGEAWENVESVTKESPDFNHTFEELDDNAIYRVVERVSGYNPEYAETNPAGNVAIKNNKDNDNPTPLNPTEPKVVNGGKKFIKTNDENKDSKDLERLAGAEFYITNKAGDKYLVASKQNAEEVTKAKSALDKAIEEYNAMDAETQNSETGTNKKAEIDKAQEAYNKAFVENAQAYTWGAKTDENVVVVTSDGQGRFEIKGLAYGEYKLEEKTAPNGYAKRNDKPAFKVEKDSYESNDTELKYNAENADNGYGKQIVNKKVTIPQTGGIGSIIFVVAGLMIMGLAAYKMKANKEQA